MPEIPNALAPPGEEALKANEKYTIINVEEFQSTINKFKGYRLLLHSPSVPLIAIPLWITPGDVSRTSKLGCFVSTFGNDTDKWIKKSFMITAWTSKNRQIVEVK